VSVGRPCCFVLWSAVEAGIRRIMTGVDKQCICPICAWLIEVLEPNAVGVSNQHKVARARNRGEIGILVLGELAGEGLTPRDKIGPAANAVKVSDAILELTERIVSHIRNPTAGNESGKVRCSGNLRFVLVRVGHRSPKNGVGIIRSELWFRKENGAWQSHFENDLPKNRRQLVVETCEHHVRYVASDFELTDVTQARRHGCHLIPRPHKPARWRQFKPACVRRHCPAQSARTGILDGKDNLASSLCVAQENHQGWRFQRQNCPICFSGRCTGQSLHEQQ
jgi:hypothetical protein